MRPGKARYQLWQIMLTIGVLAGLFAAFGVAVAAVIAGISLPILLAGPGRRVRAMVWVASLYPFLILAALYATWFTAWSVLGHAPRAYTDDPDRLNPVVNTVRGVGVLLTVAGALLIWFVYAPLILAIANWNMTQRKTPVGKGMMQLLIPVFAWLSANALIRWDPCDVLTWFID